MACFKVPVHHLFLQSGATTISSTIIPPDNFVKAKINVYLRMTTKKTPAGKGGEEPAGEKEEMLQQNANRISRFYSLAICSMLSFAFLNANIMPYSNKKISY